VGQLQVRALELAGTDQPAVQQRGDDGFEARVVLLMMAENLELAEEPDAVSILDIDTHRLVDGGCTGRETRQQ